MANDERTPTRWVLLDGSRLAIAGLLVAVTFLVLVVLGSVGVVDLQNDEAVRGVATAFIPGLIAFLSIVLGINQLVLSQEFGSAGEIRDQIEHIREYRHDVEDIAGTGPSPVQPVDFLSFVVQTLKVEADRLDSSVDQDTNPAVRGPVTAYARTVVDDTDRVHDTLESLHSGRINALLPVLEYNDSGHLYEARRLQHDYGEDLPPDTRESLARLIEVLELFSVARSQFRTTYTQRVLARLSRQLLYVGIPALVVVVLLGLVPSAPPFLVADQQAILTVSALFSVALAPLAVLAAYLLRVATVSERTIAVGPFVSRPGTTDTDERSDQLPLDEDVQANERRDD